MRDSAHSAPPESVARDYVAVFDEGTMEFLSFFYQIVGVISDVSGFVAAVISAAVFLELKGLERKAKEDVHVLLRLEGEVRSIELPLSLKRRDVSRAELLGRIGMLPMRQTGARFALRALSSPAFMQAMNEVVDGKSSRLAIPCTGEEIDQFDL